jgi:hypothetical protein
MWDTENVDVKTNDKVKQEPILTTSILTITVLFVVFVGAAPVIMESQWPLCNGPPMLMAFYYRGVHFPVLVGFLSAASFYMYA